MKTFLDFWRILFSIESEAAHDFRNALTRMEREIGEAEDRATETRRKMKIFCTSHNLTLKPRRNP